MQKFPFTKGKYIYIDDPEVRKDEFAMQMEMIHPELTGDSCEQDILYVTKFDKDGKKYWRQGIFNGIYKDEATLSSKNAKNKKGKPSNTIIKRPDINSHINTYVSVGELKKGSDHALIDNVERTWVLYCDIDIHNVSVSVVDNMVPKVFGTLMQAVYAKKLPKFNLVNLTGGGLGLFFRYKEPLCFDDPKNKLLHMSLFNKINEVINGIINENKDIFSVDEKIVVKADTQVGNINRNCRISGSYHMSSPNMEGRFTTILAIDDEYHDFTKLCHFMGVNTDIEIKEKTEEKPCIVIDDNDISFTCVERTSFSAASINCAKRRMEQLVEIMNIRGGYDGNRRHNALFCFFNYARICYDADRAIKYTKELNESFAEPIKDGSWFKTLFSGKYYDVLSGDVFSKILDLNGNEEKDIKLYERKKEREARKERKIVKAEKKQLAVSMFHQGFSYKEIIKEVGCCASTCYKWLKEAGIDVKDKRSASEKNSEKTDDGEVRHSFFENGATINNNNNKPYHNSNNKLVSNKYYSNNNKLYSNTYIVSNGYIYRYIYLFNNKYISKYLYYSFNNNNKFINNNPFISYGYFNNNSFNNNYYVYGYVNSYRFNPFRNNISLGYCCKRFIRGKDPPKKVKNHFSYRNRGSFIN